MKRTSPKPKRKASSRGGWSNKPTAPPVLTAGRKRNTRFQPGQSGNVEAQFKPGVSGNPAGRPLGARSKVTEAFLEALGEAWAKHGPDCLEWLARNDKATFVQVVASLIPRNARVELETAQKPIYVMSDRPLSPEEWESKFCEPKSKPN